MWHSWVINIEAVAMIDKGLAEKEPDRFEKRKEGVSGGDRVADRQASSGKGGYGVWSYHRPVRGRCKNSR